MSSTQRITGAGTNWIIQVATAVFAMLGAAGFAAGEAFPIPASERAALLSLYSSTNGAGWTNNGGWNDPGTNECNWHGVQCSSTPVGVDVQLNVYLLWIDNNNLTGPLPNLSALTHLRDLHLWQNHLTGPLPPLSGLTALQSVAVYSNQLTGLGSLSGLTVLKHFRADQNQLAGGIPSLSGLAALQTFYVNNNQLTGPFPDLSGLTALQSISVSSNQLTGPVPAISGLPALQYIYGDGNNFTGVTSLSGLTALRGFSFAGNPGLTGPMPSLTGLSSLQSFNFRDSQLTGPFPSLDGLTALLFFDIENNHLSGPISAAPVSLQHGHTNMCGNNLTSSGNPAIDAAWDYASSGFLSCQHTTGPTCIPVASPASIFPGNVSYLNANCSSPSAVSWLWSGGNCAGSTSSLCSAKPAATTTYSVVGTNAYGYAGPSANVTVVVQDITGNVDFNNTQKANSQATGTDANAAGVCPCMNPASKDPVNLATGLYFDTMHLIDVSAGAPLQASLSYSSGSIGWRHSHQYSFTTTATGVSVTWPDAHQSLYQSNGGGDYINLVADAQDKLVQNPDGTHTLTDRRQKIYTFSLTGQLLGTVDRLGFAQSRTYLANGNLDKVTDALSGRFLQFAYDAQDRLAGVSSAGAGAVTLAYSAAGDLASVTDPLGYTTSFTYDANHRLLTKINALSATVVTNTYDAATGRVVSQDDGLPGTPLELFSYGTSMATGNPYTTHTNRAGSTTRHDFDPRLNVLTTTDALGNSVTRAYDDPWSRTVQSAETDALARVTQFTYDASGYILTRTDAAGHVASYTYDAAHDIVSSIDEVGLSTDFTYDAGHRLLTRTGAVGRTFTYNAQGLLATSKTPNNGVTSYAYDAAGQLITITDPVGLATRFTYDAAGRILTTTDGAGKVWTKTRDLMGRVLSVADPLGNTARYTYDALGRLATTTAPGGGVTQYAYDIHDNLTSITDPLGGVTNMAYDADDRLVGTTDALGHTTTMTRDAKGRITTTTNALGNTTMVGYDAVDNVVTRRDALNNVTTLTYDNLRRPVSITDPLANQNSATYDAMGRVAVKTDGKAGQTSFAYDVLGRLLNVTDARGGIARQTFDANSNRATFVDAVGNRTSFFYDAANRIVQVSTANGFAGSYSYGTQNLVTSTVNGRGQGTSYSYSNAGQLTSTNEAGIVKSFTYDANGNLLTASEVIGQARYVYDAANRMTSFTDVFGKVIGYGYDAVGNLTTLTYPGNKVVTYTYDAANRMTSVKDWANRLTSYTYNAMGNVIAINRANGTSGAYAYDAKGQQTSLAETFPAAAGNYGVALAFDANGNVASEVTTPSLGSPTLPATTMTYAVDNRLATSNGLAVAFDGDGNMTSGPLNGVASTFTYDRRSNLIGVGASTYVYDAQGRRVSATNAGVVTRYVVDPNAILSRVLMETTAAGVAAAYYVYGAAGLESRESAAGAYQTYHYDLRGSTLKLADAAGAVTDTYHYGPFGELLSTAGASANPFKYNGRDGVMTEASGLYYMRARYYSPEVKRFVSRDPLLGSIDQALTLNRFAYVNGNPVRYVDPTGYETPTGVSDETLIAQALAIARVEQAAFKNPSNASWVAKALAEMAVRTRRIDLIDDPESQVQFRLKHYDPYEMTDQEVENAWNAKGLCPTGLGPRPTKPRPQRYYYTPVDANGVRG